MVKRHRMGKATYRGTGNTWKGDMDGEQRERKHVLETEGKVT